MRERRPCPLHFFNAIAFRRCGFALVFISVWLWFSAANSDGPPETATDRKPIVFRPLELSVEVAEGIRLYIEERDEMTDDTVILVTSEKQFLGFPVVSLTLGDRVVLRDQEFPSVPRSGAVVFHVHLTERVATTRKAWMRHRAERYDETPRISSQSYLPIRVGKLNYMKK